MSDQDRPSPILSPCEIDRLMAAATPHERQVLAARYGIEPAQGKYRTTTEVAELLGEPRDDVRAAEGEAVRRFSEVERERARAPSAASAEPSGDAPSDA